MKSEMFGYYEEEIYRGLRLFGWANNNQQMLTGAFNEGMITWKEFSDLIEIHRKAENEDQYQF